MISKGKTVPITLNQCRIQHILRFSLARTLAAKFKISVKRVFQRFGSNITVTVKAEDGKPDRKVSFHLNSDWEKTRLGGLLFT